MNEFTDTIILHQELAYADSLPVAMTVAAGLVDVATLAGWTERNLRLLQACAALEETTQLDVADEASPYAAELQRIDLKVNLLLELVGLLVAASQSRPAPAALRFNVQGMLWRHNGPLPPVDTPVRIEIYLRENMVQPLTLMGHMREESAGGMASVRFDDLPEPVADHIKKLVFRRHRRQVAVARATRRS